ncbi:MAG: peptidylprolyl isomerase [Planctomycetota bacterium]
MLSNHVLRRAVHLAVLVLVAAAVRPIDAKAQGVAGSANTQKTELPSDPATVMAVVGQSQILWGDIQPKVDAQIKRVLSSMGQQDFPQEELTRARQHLTRGALQAAIQTKMMSECFLLDQVGTESAEKRKEVAEMMAMRARQMFFQSQIPDLKKKYGTDSVDELEEKLNEEGSSLRQQQREFTDMMLGHLYMKSKLDRDPPVSIAEITIAYRENLNSYARKSQAKWEQLSVLFENHSSKEAARAKLIDMGGEAFQTQKFGRIARERSEEPFAADGGVHDWTSQGALASKPLDEQIFTIPVDRMSEIIEDSKGLHIIRVLDRRPAGTVPLAQVQDDIRKELKAKKVSKAEKEMLAEMRNRVPVWSIYHKDTPGAMPLDVGVYSSRPSSPSTLTSSGQ